MPGLLSTTYSLNTALLKFNTLLKSSHEIISRLNTKLPELNNKLPALRNSANTGNDNTKADYSNEIKQTLELEEKTAELGFTSAKVQNQFEKAGAGIASSMLKGKSGVEDLIRSVIVLTGKIIALQAIKAGLNSFIPGAGSLVSGIVGGLFHKGGLVGRPAETVIVNPAAFRNAPSFASGGIPVIAHPREMILNEQQQANLWNIIRSGSGFNSQNNKINVHLSGEIKSRKNHFVAEFKKAEAELNNNIRV